VNRLLKSAARGLFHGFGGMHLLRYQGQGGLRILMYHSFGGAPTHRSELERQCEYMRKHYHVVSLSEMADALREGRPFPTNSLAVTVDDGYQDFFTVAYPAFSKYGIPAMVFLVTDFLDRRSWLWFDQVRYAFTHSRCATASIPLGSEALTFHLAGMPAQERRRTAQVVTEKAKRLPNSARLQMLQELPASLGISIPDQPPDEFAPLTWNQVREAAKNGMEFGAHTKSHPILSRLNDADGLRDEIVGSKRRVEEELGQPVAHFCYPNGGREDFHAEALELARQAGYHTAVTAEPGLNCAGADPFLLKRIGVEPEMPQLYFRERVAGFRLKSSPPMLV
jgi:peptidoglycan/xylan/chitin deacetylase (PgdA/CDA1 family)